MLKGNFSFFFCRIVTWPLSPFFSFLLQDCDLAIERDPKEFAAWFNRGNALARLQDYGGALDSYRTAADLAPGIAGYR